ncbi:hypothetical protein RchiOBHm_Chr4g0424781 [Rosa chinensis]|uniref:Uncharacterized protein n=1 Tax=Rosa chinensis TaxID=74649 RepID=A0A2P6QYZ3_ROSCH|nr:hypothetical protein RchiOBHm_Chr4g0424781 [Rosa chinensis]
MLLTHLNRITRGHSMVNILDIKEEYLLKLGQMDQQVEDNLHNSHRVECIVWVKLIIRLISKGWKVLNMKFNFPF